MRAYKLTGKKTKKEKGAVGAVKKSEKGPKYWREVESKGIRKTSVRRSRKKNSEDLEEYFNGKDPAIRLRAREVFLETQLYDGRQKGQTNLQWGGL